MAHDETIKAGYNRITDIISMFSDFSMIQPEVLQNAADRGTRVHGAIDEYIQCATTSSALLETDRPYFESFVKWYEGSVFMGSTKEILYGETRLYDEKRFITGQFDGVWKHNDGLMLIDWKTASTVNYLSWPLQATGYMQLVKTNKFCDCTNRVCFLKLDKHGAIAREYIFEITEFHHHMFNWCVKQYAKSSCERMD